MAGRPQRKWKNVPYWVIEMQLEITTPPSLGDVEHAIAAIDPNTTIAKFTINQYTHQVEIDPDELDGPVSQNCRDGLHHSGCSNCVCPCHAEIGVTKEKTDG
jgi:hypothetical protein